MANPIVVRRVRSETEMAAWFEARREIFGDLESSPHDEHDHDPIPGLDGTTRYYSAFTTGDAGEELEHVGIVRMMVGTAKQVPSAKIVLPVDWITEGLYGEPSRFGVIRRLQRSRQSWRIILALVGGVMIDALSPDDPNEPVIDNLVHTLREALWKPLSGFYPFHPGPDLIYYPPDAGGPATEEPIIWAQSNPAEVVAASRLLLSEDNFNSMFPFGPPAIDRYPQLSEAELRSVVTSGASLLADQLAAWPDRLRIWKEGGGQERLLVINRLHTAWRWRLFG